MSKITDCQKCIFYSQEDWCSFGIPESITSKNIIVDPETKTIDNYRCSYAFGKEVFEKNKNSYTKENIIDHIIKINKINYTLVINFDTVNKPISTILEKIHSSSFSPKNLVCFGKNIDGAMVAAFDKYLKIPWKANKILPHIDEAISIISGIDVVINKYDSTCFFYISNETTFDNMDDSMNYIHIESVINQNYGIFMKNSSILDGLFMTYDIYNILGADRGKFFYTPDLFFKDNPDCKLVLYND